MAARHQDLRFRDGRGLVLVVLQRQRSAGEHFRFPGIEGDGAHGIARFLRPVEAVQDFVSAFDDVGGYVALVGNATVRQGRSEERSVGKESVSTCRSRWSQEHEKKNNTT